MLHVIKNWPQVLQNLCGMLTDKGALCLIGDYGDIYSEALGRRDSNNVDPNLSKFWKRYIELRKEVGAPSPESSQIGCKWDLESTEIALWLEQNNFYESSRSEIDWTEKFSTSDLIKIVEERCYSSMFTLDAKMMESSLRGSKLAFVATDLSICQFQNTKLYVGLSARNLIDTFRIRNYAFFIIESRSYANL